jgi:hypothetical protein
MAEALGLVVSDIIKAYFMLPPLRKQQVKHISIQQKILKKVHGKLFHLSLLIMIIPCFLMMMEKSIYYMVQAN